MKRRNLIKDKRGGFTDLFLFIILTFAVALISVVFVFMGDEAKSQLHESMDNMDIGSDSQNVSQIIEQTVGKTTQAYNSLKWISILLIVGMMLGIMIGSFMVTTKPIFFIPYLFIVIIAVFVSVPISNAYEDLMEDPTLAPTFQEFTGTNWLVLQLPIWVTIIGFLGAIIMFTRLGRREEEVLFR